MKNKNILYSTSHDAQSLINKWIMCFVVLEIIIIAVFFMSKTDDFLSLISFSATILGITVVPAFFKYETTDNIVIYNVLLINKDSDKISIAVKSFTTLLTDVKYKVDFQFDKNFYTENVEDSKQFLNKRKHICVSRKNKPKLYEKILEYIVAEKDIKIRVFIEAGNPAECNKEVKMIEFIANIENTYISNGFNINIDDYVGLDKEIASYNIDNMTRYELVSWRDRLKDIKKYYNDLKVEDVSKKSIFEIKTKKGYKYSLSFNRKKYKD